jgi:hypothetical protein
MKQHLQKAERVRLGGSYITKSPKAKWARLGKKASASK